MDVTLLCSDPGHPVYPRLIDWVAGRQPGTARVINRASEASGGRLLVLVSCTEMIGADVRGRFEHTLVLHASDLPQGRGWSPHVWSVVMGQNGFVVSLIEASEKVDRGRIWQQRRISLRGDELHDEINARLFDAELELLDCAVDRVHEIVPRAQDDAQATYWRRRTPEDSRIDPDKSLSEQFDLLRVCDPDRFPAFFELRGHRYEIVLRKAESR